MGLTIGVTGASGGLGASTLVATLAMRAHAVHDSCRVSVGVDLDPRGGLETTMCLEHLEGLRWADVESSDWEMPIAAGPVQVASLPGAEGVHVLSGAGENSRDWPVVIDVLEAFASVVGHVVIVDCGPRPTAELLSHIDLLVVLARTTARGVADLAVLTAAAPLNRTTAVLVTRAPGRDRHGDILAGEMRVPFLGHLPDDSAVRRHEREGVAPGILRSMVDAIADDVLALAETTPSPQSPGGTVIGPRVASA